jgi:hypothetical protein
MPCIRWEIKNSPSGSQGLWRERLEIGIDILNFLKKVKEERQARHRLVSQYKRLTILRTLA